MPRTYSRAGFCWMLDYLSAFYLGCEIRRHHPGVILVTGGYHPSARPGDFLPLPGSELEEPSPFDHVLMGDGERPLARIATANMHTTSATTSQTSLR